IRVSVYVTRYGICVCSSRTLSSYVSHYSTQCWITLFSSLGSPILPLSFTFLLFFLSLFFFFFSSRRRHTRLVSDWSSDVCSSDLSSGPRTRASRRRASSCSASQLPAAARAHDRTS